MPSLPVPPDPILADLTDVQRAAVTHGEGPLLILAGAGTGKTRVITRRIAHLIAARRARPEEILALTFTDRAAAEMEERVDLLVPYGYADVWISTFHAFGDRVLREEALHLGLRPDFRVLSQAEQLVFLRDHLFALPLRRLRPLGDPARHLEALQTQFSRAKDEDVTPQEYLAHARKTLADAEGRGDPAALSEAEKQAELAETYAVCARLMAERGLLDFGDQVVLTLRLFREHPEVLRRYQERFRYILVDEFQDTNYAQWALVRLLAEARRNVTVVGDDDQSIYKFRGAAASNLQAFRETFPGATPVVLTESYRSPQPILDAAYRLIQHNNPERLEVQAGVDKRLTARLESRVPSPESQGASLDSGHSTRDPGLGTGSPPAHLLFGTLSAEADGVAGRIAERVAAGAWRHRDVAILVRARRDADPFLRALNMQGIPWRCSGNQGLYAREEVRLLVSFLRALADPGDGASLFHLAASELYRMPHEDLAVLGARARRLHRPLGWVLARLLDGGLAHLETLPEAPQIEVSPEGRAAAARLLKDLEQYRRIALERPTGQVLYLFLSESGWLQRLLGAASPAAEAEAQNLGRFFSLVQEASALLRLDRVTEFVPHLDALREAGDDPAAAEAEPDADAVQVLTVHKAKGLEFPVVFLVNLVADRFPSRSRREPLPLPEALVKDRVPAGDPHLAEERRLFYVGMTRAMRELFLTAARDHGGSRPRKVSRFVLEALDLAKDEVRPYRVSAAEALRRHAPPAQVEEGAAPLPPSGPLRLSFYQVDDYRTCPLKYKYIHLLRVPVREHHAIAYGRALHEAISAFLRARAAGHAMTEAELLRAFDAAWTNEGFLSREHEELRRAAGEAALRRFHQDEAARGVPPARVEQPFGVRLAGEWFEGRWDRIDERDGRVAIVDYKSSEVREQREADRRARESLQLKLYALAYGEAHGRLPDRVELRFIESGLAGAHAPDAAWAADALEAVRAAAAGLRACDFTARPGYLQCSTCPFRQICPSTAWASLPE
jgi:DNA helicase-2/ATP-dependent DNA helicase PcrA